MKTLMHLCLLFLLVLFQCSEGEIDRDSDTDTDTDTYTGGDVDGDSDTDTDNDTDSDSDMDTDTDTDSDSDTDTDTDADIDTDSDSDSDTDVDGDTWVDPDTGLMWITSPWNALPSLSQDDAILYCQNLDYAGNTDWRLPDIEEMRTVVVDCPDIEPEGDCGVTEDCLESYCVEGCIFCDDGNSHQEEVFGGPFMYLWSSSPIPDWPEYGWTMSYANAGIVAVISENPWYVRCVR